MPEVWVVVLERVSEVYIRVTPNVENFFTFLLLFSPFCDTPPRVFLITLKESTPCTGVKVINPHHS